MSKDQKSSIDLDPEVHLEDYFTHKYRRYQWTPNHVGVNNPHEIDSAYSKVTLTLTPKPLSLADDPPNKPQSQSNVRMTRSALERSEGSPSSSYSKARSDQPQKSSLKNFQDYQAIYRAVSNQDFTSANVDDSVIKHRFKRRIYTS